MLTLLQYLDSKGWEGKRSGDGWIGCCPIHIERHPSFKVYGEGEKEWWECFHEGRRTGDIKTMINILEFGDNDTTAAWHQVFQRYEALGGRVEEDRSLLKRQVVERPGATDAQRAIMTEAMQYWHEQLWLRQASAGRNYLQERGVSIQDIRLYRQIGYAPPTTRQVYDEFSYRMRHVVGLDWEQTAKEVGLLSEKTGRIGMWNRVIFCSMQGDACVYFQGRSIQPLGSERLPYAHMGAKLVRKYPFSLPVPHPAKNIFVYPESGFGSTILATYALPSAASQGAPSKELVQFMTSSSDRLHIVATDTDIAHQYHDGRSYFPGESHAKKLTKMLEEYHRPWKRVAPPPRYKDLDAWIREERSIEPFLQQIG